MCSGSLPKLDQLFPDPKSISFPNSSKPTYNFLVALLINRKTNRQTAVKTEPAKSGDGKQEIDILSPDHS